MNRPSGITSSLWKPPQHSSENMTAFSGSSSASALIGFVTTSRHAGSEHHFSSSATRLYLIPPQKSTTPGPTTHIFRPSIVQVWQTYFPTKRKPFSKKNP